MIYLVYLSIVTLLWCFNFWSRLIFMISFYIISCFVLLYYLYQSTCIGHLQYIGVLVICSFLGFPYYGEQWYLEQPSCSVVNTCNAVEKRCKFCGIVHVIESATFQGVHICFTQLFWRSRKAVHAQCPLAFTWEKDSGKDWYYVGYASDIVWWRLTMHSYNKAS